ncbi:mannitol-1-phosphate 5-dehydrogenase [Striga asiatica]|uniref:Mannitol-1-phosphate 5-dehydrogenase n=1 Tax=Striga asiatica TaxID=4170 RepID=A0A5A7QKX8_STRAF|nr:mannitol-1-phosphate 5-dehydrogenase [Striga asiatica]
MDPAPSHLALGLPTSLFRGPIHHRTNFQAMKYRPNQLQREEVKERGGSAIGRWSESRTYEGDGLRKALLQKTAWRFLVDDQSPRNYCSCQSAESKIQSGREPLVDLLSQLPDGVNLEAKPQYRSLPLPMVSDVKDKWIWKLYSPIIRFLLKDSLFGHGESGEYFPPPSLIKGLLPPSLSELKAKWNLETRYPSERGTRRDLLFDLLPKKNPQRKRESDIPDLVATFFGRGAATSAGDEKTYSAAELLSVAQSSTLDETTPLNHIMRQRQKAQGGEEYSFLSSFGHIGLNRALNAGLRIFALDRRLRLSSPFRCSASCPLQTTPFKSYILEAFRAEEALVANRFALNKEKGVGELARKEISYSYIGLYFVPWNGKADCPWNFSFDVSLVESIEFEYTVQELPAERYEANERPGLG